MGAVPDIGVEVTELLDELEVRVFGKIRGVKMV